VRGNEVLVTALTHGSTSLVSKCYEWQINNL
jgi:hypothetical protein